MASCPPSRCRWRRAAGVVRPGHQGVVRPLAVGVPDRVDRRQVEDVETHRGDGREPGLGLGEGGAAGRIGALRAREHLVPGGEAGPHPIDLHVKLAVVARDDRRVDAARRQVHQHRIERQLQRLVDALYCRRPSRAPLQQVVRSPSAPISANGREQPRAFEQVAADVLAGVDLLLRVGGPGAVHGRGTPRRCRCTPRPSASSNVAAPPIVVHRTSAARRARSRRRGAVHDAPGDDVVALLEQVSLDDERGRRPRA